MKPSHVGILAAAGISAAAILADRKNVALAQEDLRPVLLQPVKVPGGDIFYPISYPDAAMATNYLWIAETSTDLLNWVEQPRVYDNNGNLIVKKNGAKEFYLRLKGEPLLQ